MLLVSFRLATCRDSYGSLGDLRDFPVLARHGLEQLSRICVLRAAEHVVDGAPLHDLAIAHDDDVVADLRSDAKVVGDEQKREAKLPLDVG